MRILLFNSCNYLDFICLWIITKRKNLKNPPDDGIYILLFYDIRQHLLDAVTQYNGILINIYGASSVYNAIYRTYIIDYIKIMLSYIHHNHCFLYFLFVVSQSVYWLFWTQILYIHFICYKFQFCCFSFENV